MEQTNIFLTGLRGVGKTTLINRFVKTLDFMPAGFQTFVTRTDEGTCGTVWLRPYAGELASKKFSGSVAGGAVMIAEQNGEAQGMRIHTDAFEQTGVEILRQARMSDKERKRPRLIIMDELGFLEREALSFQEEVLRCLECETPVLGVLKATRSPSTENIDSEDAAQGQLLPASTPFLDALRRRADIQIIEVTAENREAISLSPMFEN